MRTSHTIKKLAFALAMALGITAAASRSNGQEDGGAVVKEAYPLSRYEGLWKNSLFGPKGASEPVAAAAPSHLSLVGVFEVDGVEHAVLMDTSNGMTEEINGVRASASGSRLAKIESSPDLMKTRVQVERGGSLIWVGYRLDATVKASAQQAKADRLRVLQEKQGAVGTGGGKILDEGGHTDAKSELPRTVVLPSTIPVTGRP